MTTSEHGKQRVDEAVETRGSADRRVAYASRREGRFMPLRAAKYAKLPAYWRSLLELVLQTGIFALPTVVRVGCGRSCNATLGGPHAPTALPVRPLRPRVGTARTAAGQGRKARPAAQVDDPAGRRRRLLPPEERLLVADASSGVPYGRQTVYYHFRRWRLDGRLKRAHDRLREEVREAEGRDRDPSAAVIDSQVVKTTRVGGPERGYDGAKAEAPHLGGQQRSGVSRKGSMVPISPIGTAEDTCWTRDKGCRGWICSKPTVHTRAASASGYGASWGGAWRCPTTATGSCGATGWRKDRAASRSCLAVGS